MNKHFVAGFGTSPRIAPKTPENIRTRILSRGGPRVSPKGCRARDGVAGNKERKGFPVKISIQNRDDVKIVHVSGAVESHAAGEFFDALLDCVGDGTTKLIVDLSGVHIMARAAVRGLVVAAKLVEPDRGALRIASAPRSIEEFLQSLGFNHLLRCDQSVQASLARLQGGDGCEPSLPPRAAAVSAGR